MMKRKKFASLMPDQNIGNIGLEEALNLFCFKRFREYKEEEVQVSNGRYGSHSSWSCFCLPKDPLE
jgi:DNA topoisomerase-1